MSNTLPKRSFVWILLTLFLLSQTVPAQASRGYYGPRQHHSYSYGHPNYPHSSISLPETALAVAIAGTTYYFLDGIFYRHSPRGYVVVAPPQRVIVRRLPGRYKKIIIREKSFYNCDNVYYLKSSSGYVVVDDPYDAPVTVIQEAPPVAVAPAAAPVKAPAKKKTVTLKKESVKGKYESEGQIILQVPNSNGSFTSVTIKESKDGYVGPEGEFYEDFPKMSQLIEMYAK